MKRMLILGAALLAAPVLAQPAAPAPQAATQGPIDPARLALARTAIDHVWPLGTYARMMDGTMDQMMDTMMASMFDMRIGDLAGPGSGAAEADPKLANSTLRQLAKERDPHFEERLRIMNRVMMDEMVPVMTRFEPDIREGMARAYARKFSAQQLTDLNAFFATPSGHAYASESVMLFVDPEVMSLMGKIMPELFKEMPRIMDKVKSATAHLPLPSPPPKRPGAL